MHPASDRVELIDVVCGRPTDSESIHRYVHGGALFCFCSDECLARFIVDPSQFISIDAVVCKTDTTATRSGPPDAPPRAAPASITAIARPKEAQHHDASVAEQFRHAMASASAIASAGPPVHLGGSRVLASFFAWREKRFAARTCKELLKLHRIVSSRDPHLTGGALYRQIVAARQGGDLAAADAAQAAAEQSFAAWPAERRLKFGDVVHFLVVTEFLASHAGSRWIHADLKRIVAARIPHDL